MDLFQAGPPLSILEFSAAHFRYNSVMGASPKMPDALTDACCLRGMGGKFAVEDVSEDEDPKGYRRMAAGHKAFLASVKNGSAEMVDFDPAVPAKRAVGRLKQICKQRRIKQSDIARQLGVAPSVISRVLKHPERSRLETLRKIADAAGIAMIELI